MKSAILCKFRLERYLKHMKWKRVPQNHWAADKDGKEVHWDGRNWVVDGYIVADEWVGE
nr:hypothetical protein [uncultured Anaerosporobacter sp.]